MRDEPKWDRLLLVRLNNSDTIGTLASLLATVALVLEEHNLLVNFKGKQDKVRSEVDRTRSRFAVGPGRIDLLLLSSLSAFHLALILQVPRSALVLILV